MSVDFFSPDAPTRYVPCETCEIERECRGPNAKCYDGCTGTEEASVLPVVNFSNTNARGVLEILGLGSELYGCVNVENIPDVLQRLVVVLNCRVERQHLIRSASDRWAYDPHVVTNCETGLPTISRGIRVIECSNTDAHNVRRLTAIQDLLVKAHEEGFKVCWG